MEENNISVTIGDILSTKLPGKVSYPQSTAYTQSLISYWSKQESTLSPSCIIAPTCIEDVSIIISVLSANRINFAVRGGGHTPFAGSANLDDGITIDLRAMDNVSVNADKTVVSVGGGATWEKVYEKTDSMGIAVVGGRGSSIGVGGLILGGGISFFSPRKGFACDNVVNFEIVLADGRIVNANAQENSDLWLALKGGSNNFGIVTRFDLSAFTQGEFWGGMIIWDDSVSLQLISAFAGLDILEYDENAALILSFTFVAATGFVASGTIQYTQPIANPPTFESFTSIVPQYLNTMRISNMSQFTTEFQSFNLGGLRQLYVTNTFQSSNSFLIDIYKHFKHTFATYTNISGLQASFTIQPMPTAITNKSSVLGGNSLGLDSSTKPLVLCLLAFTWKDASHDDVINMLGKSFNDWIVAHAKAAGLWNEWVYLNYAASWQDPIGSYGTTNQARLKAVSKKYDPTGIFQNNVPGGFKILK